MLLGTILLTCLGLVLIIFILQPLWQAHRRGGVTTTPVQLLDLLAERDAVVAALRDLELDRETGKIAESDYEIMRRALLADAVRILRSLEELDAQIEAKLTAEIAHLRELARQHETSASTSTAGITP